MKQKKIVYIAVAISVVALCLTFLAYLMGQKTTLPVKPTESTTIGGADSVVTENLILLSVDIEQKKLFLQKTDSRDETITVTCNASTEVKNRYGDMISIVVLKEGEILTVRYDSESGKADSIEECKDSWEYTGIKKLKTDKSASLVKVGSEKYLFTNTLVVRSEGSAMQLEDVNEVDEVTLRGIGNRLYSITVDKGHGYVKLTNEDFYVGGWVEFGQDFIKPVEKDMQIVLPEGNYKMIIANDGIGGSVDVTVERNRQIEIDASKINYQAMELGSIRFEITPSDAELYIDGELKDYKELVTLSYGSHRIQISKDGYTTFSGKLYVKETLRTLKFALTANGDVEEEDEESAKETEEPVAEPTSSPAPTSTPTAPPTPTRTPSVSTEKPTDSKSDENETTSSDADSDKQMGDYYIHVDKPSGAEVYLDGNYVGLSPVSIKKVAGTHTITLRQSGYKTRTYNISVDSEKADVKYTFADMEKED